MGTETVLSALEVAARCLGGLGVRYALIGGAALPAWGRIRATEDADILIGTDAEMIDRAVVRRIDDLSLPVASCEDLIILKLAAGRVIDRTDAAELVRTNRANLDQAYLRRKAHAMGVGSELEEVFVYPNPYVTGNGG